MIGTFFQIGMSNPDQKSGIVEYSNKPDLGTTKDLKAAYSHYNIQVIKSMTQSIILTWVDNISSTYNYSLFVQFVMAQGKHQIQSLCMNFPQLSFYQTINGTNLTL